MADIFGHRIPQGGIKGTLAAVALVSVPVALAIGGGYAIYRGAKYVKGRLHPETDEEMEARVLRAAHRDGIVE